MGEFKSRFHHNDSEGFWVDLSRPMPDDANGEPQFERVSTFDIVEEYDELAEAFRKVSIELHVESRRAGAYLATLQKTDPNYMLEPISDAGQTVKDGIEYEIGCLVKEVEELRFSYLKAHARVLPTLLAYLVHLHSETVSPFDHSDICGCCGHKWPCQTRRVLDEGIKEVVAFIDGWTARRLSDDLPGGEWRHG